jgi:pyruvate dehydrogenase E1 component alpha subunit
LNESGPTTEASTTASEPGGIPPDELPNVYRTMVTARLMDERCMNLQRQGRLGFYVPLQGQEAAQVGCAWALDPTDWIFPAYRELGVALCRGIPLELLIDQLIGNAGDDLKGRQMPNHFGYRRYRFVPASSPVGTQIIHAVGTAMAARSKGERIVTIAFFGDGTTSSNDFHSGLNFGGVYKAPTIFFCQNNQWAISYPRSRQTRSETLAEKGAAYGVPGIVVDGMDVHAVYRAVSQARERALAGGGPTLIEAQVYRLGPHTTSDDPSRYRTSAEVDVWKARDPLPRLRAELLASGALTEASDRAIWEEIRAKIAAAVNAGEATPPVDPLTMFDDVFARMPPLLEAQRAEMMGTVSKGGPRP